jgi:zinc D-Ala-D-Ala carboxypeptidase
MNRTAAQLVLGRAVKAGAACLVAVVAAAFGLIGCQSAPVTPGTDATNGDHRAATWAADGKVTRADGVLPDGVTVFDTKYPGIANLEPGLLQSLQGAANSAAGDGVSFLVHSAWRSPEYQNQLLRKAISTYGSRKKAARWVATADTSAHVSGQAVDLESAASTWLSRHGAQFALCRVYRNEPWHFELRGEAVEHGCPAPYANPTKDPRMRQ